MVLVAQLTIPLTSKAQLLPDWKNMTYLSSHRHLQNAWERQGLWLRNEFPILANGDKIWSIRMCLAQQLTQSHVTDITIQINISWHQLNPMKASDQHSKMPLSHEKSEGYVQFCAHDR